MKKITTLFLVTLLLTIPKLASAACTFTQTELKSGTASCSLATETIAPTDSSSLGWNFGSGVCPRGVSAFICSTSGNLASGSVKLFVFNDLAGKWGEVPDLSATVSATATCQGFPGVWTVVQGGRFALVPSGVGGSGPWTIWMRCQ